MERITMNRKENQGYLAFVEEATKALQDKEISYLEWCESIVGEKVYSDETLRRCSILLSKILSHLENEETQSMGDDRIKRLEEAKEELIQERKKLSDVNREAQEYYRSRSRTELFKEEIKKAIALLKPITPAKITEIPNRSKSGVLVIADAHYDSNFEIKGVFGETVNKYDKETFKARMWLLRDKMLHDNLDIDELTIVFSGDSLEGLIRASSLKKLRQPVVKSTIEFAEFVSQWLVEMQRELNIPITAAFVPGNHTICRYLSQKPEFEDENLEYIIHAFVSIRLEDCEDITVEPYDDVYFTTVQYNNLLFAHGENKSLENLMSYFENLYDITIDTCYGAHYHSEANKSVGVSQNGSKRIIRVPSMCGTDPYAKKILKHNRAGAYFAVYSENGEEYNKTYYLN